MTFIEFLKNYSFHNLLPPFLERVVVSKKFFYDTFPPRAKIRDYRVARAHNAAPILCRIKSLKKARASGYAKTSRARFFSFFFFHREKKNNDREKIGSDYRWATDTRGRSRQTPPKSRRCGVLMDTARH